MIFYQLHRRPDEAAGEGEDWDEWFTSLAAAKKRRTQLAHEALNAWAEECVEMREKYGEESVTPSRPYPDLAIDRVTIADLPPKQLALALLNRRRFVTKTERVVENYPFDER